MSTAPEPLRGTAESRMTQEGQMNAGGLRRLDENGKPYYDPAPLSEYPRMLYKATTVEQVQESADSIADLKDKPMVINRFDGMLCETCIAKSLTEAEALAELGWEATPKAAHGMEEGLAASASAKDEEIAALKAQLAERQSGAGNADNGETRRAPGRPRINREE